MLKLFDKKELYVSYEDFKKVEKWMFFPTFEEIYKKILFIKSFSRS